MGLIKLVQKGKMREKPWVTNLTFTHDDTFPFNSVEG
jgi:hypothetical protein